MANLILKETKRNVKMLEDKLVTSNSELEKARKDLEHSHLEHGKTQSMLSEMGLANQEANILLVDLE